eukprot:c9321_g1_i1.p1 GENE.c9321_g1_i1~~c9321_g1_i1.p1  ORF type:complete len:163 (+),score=53.91 c9321_g1_i1:126-614(+)
MIHSTSNSQLDSFDENNQNTIWIGSKGAWTMFAIAILFAKYLFGLTGMEAGTAWSIVHILHVSVSFVTFHWVKGSPVDTMSNSSSQGRTDPLTWWEQLDGGNQWTQNKKYLAFLVVFTYIAAVYATLFHPFMILIHTGFLCLGLIPKLPGLYRVRLFGINED